jgi:hypothetical protein
MTRSLILAVAVSGTMLTPAAAESSTSLKPAFKNTIVSTYPSGRSTRLWLAADGSSKAQRTNGRFTKGKWSRKGDEVCLRQTGPIPIPITFCSPIPAVYVGATWRGKSPKGEPLTNRLVAGRP